MDPIITLDELITFLDTLPLREHTYWMHAIIHRQQKRVRRAEKAALEANPTRDSYGPDHYGSLGAKRED